MILAVFLSIALIKSGRGRLFFVPVIILILVILYDRAVYKYLFEKQKVLGALILPDGVRRQKLFGEKETISYLDLRQEISEGCMKFGKEGILLGKGKNKLVFYYEVASTKAQKHIRECYLTL